MMMGPDGPMIGPGGPMGPRGMGPMGPMGPGRMMGPGGPMGPDGPRGMMGPDGPILDCYYIKCDVHANFEKTFMISVLLIKLISL